MAAMLDAALEYAARGFHVFPCKPKGKKPMVPGGCNAATIDVQKIRQWWSQWPEANIGIATGKKSGIAVLDIDPRHGGDDALSDIEAKYGKLPETPMSITGGGGRHYFFAYRDGFRNSANKISAGVDTRGDGGYVIAAPSVHENGKPYEWELSSDISEVSLAPLPDWIASGQIPKVHRNGTTNGHANGTGNLNFTAGHVPHDGAPVAEGGRNVALASLAGQWIQAGDDFKTILAKAKAWNATNPSPLSAAEVDQTCASVAATHVKNNPLAVIPIESAIPTIEEPEETEEELQPAPVPSWRKFPPELLTPPGILGEITKWITATAYMPQPELALGNTIAFCGAVVGRMIATPSDLRTNFYCLGVSESGSGKDFSRNFFKQVVATTMGYENSILAGEDVSSDSAILESVFHTKRLGKQWPSCLFQFDEIGHMLSQASAKNSGAHMKAIPVVFTKLFSSANSLMLGKEYADRRSRPRQDINQPNVCIYGTTVPGRLAAGLTPNEIRDGFLGRMLVFISSNPDPEVQNVDDEKKPIPEWLKTWVRSWMERAPNVISDGNLSQTIAPEVAKIERAAESVFRDFASDVNAKKIVERENNDGFDAIWARTAEHARKLALVISAGIEEPELTITESIAIYSCSLARHLTDSLIAWSKDHIAENEHERNMKRVLKLIRSKRSGISMSELTRKMQWLDKKNRESIIGDLLEGGLVEEFRTPARSNGRKPGRVYKAKR